MEIGASEVLDAVEFAVAAIQDESMKKSAYEIAKAQRQYLEARAASKREVSSALIMCHEKLEMAVRRFNRIYEPIENELSEELKARLRKMRNALEIQKKALVHEKNRIERTKGSLISKK